MTCCRFRCGNSIICRVVTILFIAAGVVMSCFAIYSCDFLLTSDGDSIGLFSYIEPGQDECVRYDDVFDDSLGWQQIFASICSVAAPALGSAVILVTVLEFCLENCCVGLLRSLLLCFAEISQMFTFAIYGTSECAIESYDDVRGALFGGCTISQGSIFSIIAFGLYIIAGIFLCFSPNQKSLCKETQVDAEQGVAAKNTKPEAKETVETPTDNDVEAVVGAGSD